MSKEMFVTVGMSLFHSASWDPEAGLPVDVRGYAKWTETDFLTSPERRKSSGASRSPEILLPKALKRTEPREWAACLPQDLREGRPNPATFMRYSAELATILKLAEQERTEGQALGGFLASYESVHVVADPVTGEGEEFSHSKLAGLHLIAYLKAIEPSTPAYPCETAFVSSTDPEKLLGKDTGLGLLGSRIESVLAKPGLERLDLVVTGGYKIYAVVLARLARSGTPEVRLIYIHESGEQLVIYGQSRIQLNGHSYPDPTLFGSRGVTWND